MKNSKAILFLFSFAFLITYLLQALSWAPITHESTLNDVIKDPRLDPKIKKVLEENISYARADTLGPDLFNFSPYSRYTNMAHYCSSGKLAKKMLEMAKKDGDPKKIAFAYGWMIHVATDPIGHRWVNSLAGGELVMPDPIPIYLLSTMRIVRDYFGQQ